jgi:DNA-binding transcriptional LysR family regulator
VGKLGAERAGLTGVLRVSVGVDHMHTGFAEVLAEFARLHPRLTLDIVSTDAVVDLIGEGIDVAIRRGWLRDSSLKATTLGEFEQWMVASPEYLKRRGKLSHPEQLSEHACVIFSALKGARGHWALQGPNGATCTVRVAGTLRCSSPIGVLALARAGGGIASVAASTAYDDIARGALVRVLPEWKLPTAGVYAVYPASRHVAPPTRALIDFLRARYVGTRVSLA